MSAHSNNSMNFERRKTPLSVSDMINSEAVIDARPPINHFPTSESSTLRSLLNGTSLMNATGVFTETLSNLKRRIEDFQAPRIMGAAYHTMYSKARSEIDTDDQDILPTPDATPSNSELNSRRNSADLLLKNINNAAKNPIKLRGVIQRGDESRVSKPKSKKLKATRSPKHSAKPNERRCFQCNENDTPEWRKGPAHTGGTVCNACGLFYVKLLKRTSIGVSDQIMIERTRAGKRIPGSEIISINRKVPTAEQFENYIRQFGNQE